MKAKDFILALNSANFRSYPRNIVITAQDLAQQGITADPQVLNAVNAIINARKNVNRSFQTEDMEIPAFLNRTPLGLDENGKAAWGWSRGKDFQKRQTTINPQ